MQKDTFLSLLHINLQHIEVAVLLENAFNGREQNVFHFFYTLHLLMIRKQTIFKHILNFIFIFGASFVAYVTLMHFNKCIFLIESKIAQASTENLIFFLLLATHLGYLHTAIPFYYNYYFSIMRLRNF